LSSPPEPSAAAIRQALENIVASAGFTNSVRMSRFLRWVVERSLEGDAAAIREYAIGMAVFDRDPNYDPKIDTIVRVEARRLRKKLQEYYEGPGQDDVVRIEMPGPGYVPVFHVAHAGVRSLMSEPDGTWVARLRSKFGLG
jgi:hypothetical protein